MVFIFNHYDSQIPSKDWFEECKSEFNKQFNPAKTAHDNFWRIPSPYDDATYDNNLLDYYDKDRELFTKICQQVFIKNYKSYKYTRPDNIDEIVHNITILLLNIYLIEQRNIIHNSFLIKNAKNNNQSLNIIATNINSFWRRKSLFKYQEMALLALYYCNLYTYHQQNKGTMSTDYLSNAVLYSQIASQLFGYIKGNAIPLHKTRSRHNHDKNDNQVYEYIQYRVFQ